MYGRIHDFDDASDITGWFGDDFVAYALSQTVMATPVASSAPAALATTTTSASYSLAADVAAHENKGTLTFYGALAVLQDAANQPMTATLFASLQAVANSLNTSGGPAATLYVQQMFDNVVLGNSANAHWNGGAATASSLGNLSANATATQFNDLIGKWFLGTDMPGDASAPGQSSTGIAYEAYNLPLFSAGGPKLTDVSQGQIGDCWFLAALAETALQDPSLIQNMIVQRGDIFRFKFWVNGHADFVTVNNELPTYVDGAVQCDGSAMTGANSTTSLWAPLTEKALAQLSEQTGVVTGMEYASGQNQFYELNAGDGEGVTFLTDQQTAAYGLGSLSTGGLASLLGQMQSALANHEDVLLGTSGLAVSGDLVAGHMFAVTAINAASGLVSLYNPWGANAAGNGKPESFTIAASALQADDATFFAALGTAKIA